MKVTYITNSIEIPPEEQLPCISSINTQMKMLLQYYITVIKKCRRPPPSVHLPTYSKAIAKIAQYEIEHIKPFQIKKESIIREKLNFTNKQQEHRNHIATLKSRFEELEIQVNTLRKKKSTMIDELGNATIIKAGKQRNSKSIFARVINSFDSIFFSGQNISAEEKNELYKKPSLFKGHLKAFIVDKNCEIAKYQSIYDGLLQESNVSIEKYAFICFLDLIKSLLDEVTLLGLRRELEASIKKVYSLEERRHFKRLY
jgi:hypothetical protein